MQRSLRDEARLVKSTKAGLPKVVRRKPYPSDGNDGDIVLGNTSSGIKLFAKIANKWYTFSSDFTDEFENTKIINFKPTVDGTVATPSKTLTTDDTGKIYVVDVSANTALFRLPPVARSSGVNYKFIMSEESNGENSKDFIVITSSTSEDMMGTFHTAGVTSALGEDRSIVQFDSSDAVITAGDFMEFTCNGKEWYGFGISFSSNFEGADDFTIQ